MLVRRFSIGFLLAQTVSCFFRRVHNRLLRTASLSAMTSEPSCSIQRFLHNQGPISQTEQKTLRIYTGNEASDADSIISALVSAYCGHCETNSADVRHQPIVAVSRSDLRLKQDVELLLKKASLSTADLTCAEEISWHSLKDFYQNIEVVLLDHNSLHPRLEHSFQDSQLPYEVVEIIDHHLDMNQHMDSVKRRTIAFDTVTGKATAGSTCSLLVPRYQSAIEWSQASSPAILLLGVILLDTYAENPKFSKNTPIDDAAKDFLSSILHLPNDQHFALFSELANAKFDPSFWQSLSMADCLRYDYKRFVAAGENKGDSIVFGTASVLLPLTTVIRSKDDFLSTALLYLQGSSHLQEKVDALVLLSLVIDPQTQKPERELLFLTQNAELADAFRLYAHDNHVGSSLPEMNLQLSEVPIVAESVAAEATASRLTMLLFQQGNVVASRKQVAPVLLQFADTFLQLTTK